MQWVIFAKDHTAQLDDISNTLLRLERKINRMSDMETRLDAVIEGVQATVSSVVDLVGQVLAKLEAAGAPVDLSDETSTLETLQSDLQSAAERMQANLDPAPAPSEPTGDTEPV